MKKNSRLEARRKKIPNDVDIFVNHSFDIVDRIHQILQSKSKDQKYLAEQLGKRESEISKWMTGTHNFTVRTISKIEDVLGSSILYTKPTPAKTIYHIIKIDSGYTKFNINDSEKSVANQNKYHSLAEC